MDETWVHHFQPQTKHQTQQWNHLGYPFPKEAKTRMSAGKVMVCMFWDAEGVLLWKADKTSSFFRTMLRHTRPQWPCCYSSLSKTNPILLIWLHVYYLFPKMKMELGGHHFGKDDEVLNAVNHFLRDQNGAFYTVGIRLLYDRWIKCVNVGGDYVERLLHLIF